MALAGRAVRWKSPPRDDNETGWRNAVARHGTHTLVGVLWAAIVWWLNPSYLWWLLPVVGALILSIPLSVFTSRIGIGRRLRRRKYFLIPEESHPPPVIRATRRYWHHAPQPADVATAIVDPVTNALICAQAVGRTGSGSRDYISTAIAERALRDGPDVLSPADRNQLIADPAALSALHWAVWTSAARHPSWAALTAQTPARMRGAFNEPELQRDERTGDIAGVASNPAGG
jgi:membrane glycosyltransferase